MHGKHLLRAKLVNQVLEATSPLQRRARPSNLSQQLSPTSVLSLHHRAHGPGQKSKQAPVAMKNKHSSVSFTLEGSAFHANDTDHTVIATYQSRYPIARAAAENGELKKPDVAASVGLRTRQTTELGRNVLHLSTLKSVTIPVLNHSPHWGIQRTPLNQILPIGVSKQTAHSSMVPDPRITTTFCKGREAESVFQNIHFRSCSTWGFRKRGVSVSKRKRFGLQQPTLWQSSVPRKDS